MFHILYYDHQKKIKIDSEGLYYGPENKHKVPTKVLGFQWNISMLPFIPV